MTNTSTKRCVLTLTGVAMLGFGLILVYVGQMYYTHTYLLGGTIQEPIIDRAVALFAGMVLVLCGAVNTTFGFGSLRSSNSCCGPGCCQAVLINLLALLMGLACIGTPIWTSWDILTADNINFRTSTELVYLITILFSGVVVVIASISGIFVGFLPASDGSQHGDEQEMSNFGRSNTHAY